MAEQRTASIASSVNPLLAGSLGLSGLSSAAYFAAGRKWFSGRSLALNRFGAGAMVLGTAVGAYNTLSSEAGRTPLGYTAVGLSVGSTGAFLGAHLPGRVGVQMNRLGWAAMVAGGAVSAYNFYQARRAGMPQAAPAPTPTPRAAPVPTSDISRPARDRARSEGQMRQNAVGGYASVRGHYARGPRGTLVWVPQHMRSIA